MAVTARGQPCRAWAIHGSEPALCSVHAGRNAGGGAPAGNQNALKHGYYAKAIRPENLSDIQKMQDRSLLGELVLGRYVLGQLAAYLINDDLGPGEKLAVVPLINSTIRTVAYVTERIDDPAVDWEFVLDALRKERGREL